MDKSSLAKCLLYSDVMKGEPSPTGRGRRSRDEKGNQGVGDIRFTNILQLFSIYFFFSITLLYHFTILFYPRHLPAPTPTTHTHDFYPLPTTFSYTPYDGQKHIFPYRAWKWYLICWIPLHVQHTLFKVVYLSHAMCHVTSAALIL